MKKSKKHYKNRFNDFCAEAWLAINTTPQRARALRHGMQDAIMNPLEDTSKIKKDANTVSEIVTEAIEA